MDGKGQGISTAGMTCPDEARRESELTIERDEPDTNGEERRDLEEPFVVLFAAIARALAVVVGVVAAIVVVRRRLLRRKVPEREVVRQEDETARKDKADGRERDGRPRLAKVGQTVDAWPSERAQSVGRGKEGSALDEMSGDSDCNEVSGEIIDPVEQAVEDDDALSNRRNEHEPLSKRITTLASRLPVPTLYAYDRLGDSHR